MMEQMTATAKVKCWAKSKPEQMTGRLLAAVQRSLAQGRTGSIAE